MTPIFFSGIAACRGSTGQMNVGREKWQNVGIFSTPDQARPLQQQEQHQQHSVSSSSSISPHWSSGGRTEDRVSFHGPPSVSGSGMTGAGPYSHQCSCGEVLASDTQLYDHMRIVHKTFYCVQCNQMFNSAANLSYHRNKHHGQNTNLQCTFCGKFFGHKQNLRMHQIKVHKNFIQQQWGYVSLTLSLSLRQCPTPTNTCPLFTLASVNHHGHDSFPSHRSLSMMVGTRSVECLFQV